MITLRFACGHERVRVTADAESVQCPQCGETRVQSVKAPAPRFRGMVTGPNAEMTELPAKPVPVAKESLRLKEKTA